MRVEREERPLLFAILLRFIDSVAVELVEHFHVAHHTSISTHRSPVQLTGTWVDVEGTGRVCVGWRAPPHQHSALNAACSSLWLATSPHLMSPS